MTASKPAAIAIAATAKPRTANLTPKQWAEAEALWESGEVTLDDLAKHFGKNRSNFKRHFAKLGIVHGSKAEAHKKEVAKAVSAAVLDDAAVYASRIRETKEDHYKMAAGLAKLVWNEVLTAKNDKNPVSVATANLKALDLAITGLKKLREERWAILGLDRPDFIDEDGLPELVISELTAEQLEQLRARDEMDLSMSVGDAVQVAEDEEVDDDEPDVVEES